MYRQQLKHSLVLDRVVCLEQCLVNWQPRQGSGLALSDHGCDLELGHEGALLLGEDGVGHQQLVLEALLDADSGGDGVLEGVESEAEGRVVVKHLVEKLPALLYLQVVGPVQSPLVDSAPRIHLLGLALPT